MFGKRDGEMDIKKSRTKANFLGGLMRRNFLILALATAFGMALLGNASQALAGTCPPGTTGTDFAAGTKIYAIKLLGAVQDTSGTGTGATTVDVPSPVGIGGIGVFQADGTCGITGGELIYYDGTTTTAPGHIDPPTNHIVGFLGNISPGNLTGNYFFNSNNAGVLNLQDTAGHTFSFGITIEAGNGAFRGARLDAGDPVSIIGEKQAAFPVAPANPISPFLVATTVLFDAPGGGGQPGSLLGVGSSAVEAQVIEHLDPLTGSSDVEGGGGVVFNQNGGDICDNVSFKTSCFPFTSGALLGDVHITVGPGPFTSDGTQNTAATFNGDFGFPLGGAGFNQASVIWGTANQSAFVMTTATGGSTQPGAALATAGHNIAPGTNHLSAGGVTLVTPKDGTTGPGSTLTLTNDSVEPLDFTSIVVSAGLPDVVVSGSCGPTGGDVASFTAELGPQNCTITLQGNAFNQCTPGPASSICTSATPGTPYACCTGIHTGPNCAGIETGTLEITGNDHQIVPGTQTSTGVTIPVTCK
jgi:hypothetical protein